MEPPHVPAAMVVLDLNLRLPLPWPVQYQEELSDGAPVIPMDGVDLAQRLRTRNYVGTTILHSAESLAELKKLEQNPAIDQVIEKGSAANFKARFEEIHALTCAHN